MKKQALISVSDKTGVVDFARELVALGYHILSTGGTAKLLTKEGVPCQEVADYTGVHPARVADAARREDGGRHREHRHRRPDDDPRRRQEPRVRRRDR